MLAAIDDTTYNVVLLLHVLSAFVAFAPAFAHPILSSQSKSLDAPSRRAVIGFLVANGRRVYAPALVVTGLLGFGLQGLSDDVWELSQTWMLAAIVVWLAMNGILHGMVIPGEKAVSQGDEGAARIVDIGGALLSLLLIVMLVLMIWKPGL